MHNVGIEYCYFLMFIWSISPLINFVVYDAFIILLAQHSYALTHVHLSIIGTNYWCSMKYLKDAVVKPNML